MRGNFDLHDRNIKNRTKISPIVDVNAEAIINRFKNNIQNIKKRFELYDSLKNSEQVEHADDILRFQIVYVMSALDFFMHELYTYSLIRIFKGEKEKTYRYKEYRVPISLVEKAIYDFENIEHHLRESFLEINSNFTFMHPNRIRELLNIISYEDEFKLVEKRLKEEGVLYRDERLDLIIESVYERRNKIAHQTDINHGDLAANHILKQDVVRYIEIIEKMGIKLYEIICK